MTTAKTITRHQNIIAEFKSQNDGSFAFQAVIYRFFYQTVAIQTTSQWSRDQTTEAGGAYDCQVMIANSEAL